MAGIVENGWAPRKRIIIDCPSGNRCAVRRPGPELAVQIARLQRTLKPLQDVSGDAEAALERMTPEQQRASLDVMRATVVACVVEPRIYLEPKGEQVGVDDLPPEDFLYIWTWYNNGCPDVPVETDAGEVTARQVENFPVGQEPSVGTGGDSGDIRAEGVEVGRAA